MNEFAEARHSKQVRQELLEAIHGAGAFWMFRSTIRRLGIEKSSYRFHEEALGEIARARAAVQVAAHGRREERDGFHTDRNQEVRPAARQG
jgi:hypothetical protein